MFTFKSLPGTRAALPLTRRAPRPSPLPSASSRSCSPAGAAVDYARYSVAQTAMQAALDSGALAVATASSLPDPTSAIKAGSDAFEANLENTGIRPSDVTYSFKLQRQPGLGLGALSDGLGLHADRRSVGFRGRCRNRDQLARQPSKAEIALVLDYSGSMEELSGGQVKYVAMKNAAKKLVSDLEAANPKKIKIGLVPVLASCLSDHAGKIHRRQNRQRQLDGLRPGPALSRQSDRRNTGHCRTTQSGASPSPRFMRSSAVRPTRRTSSRLLR